MKHDLTHLDLFSGIGGFALAARAQGFRTVGFAETEPFPCKVLARQFPGVPNLGDVRKRNAFARLGNITVVSAGYPCQPDSLAGKRRGKSDDRWLWPAARDILATVRSPWFIGENVFGHVTLGLDQVIFDLESLGYSAQPFIIPACAVDAPHRRERVWVVAYSEHPGRQSRQVSQGRESSTLLPGQILPDANGGTLWFEPEPDAGSGNSPRPFDDREDDADADSQGEREPAKEGDKTRPRSPKFRRRRTHADAVGERCEGVEQTRTAPAPVDGSRPGDHPRRWEPEPGLGRVAHGVPHRAHRLKGLGNAIVPAAAEPFFYWIAQIEKGLLT